MAHLLSVCYVQRASCVEYCKGAREHRGMYLTLSCIISLSTKVTLAVTTKRFSYHRNHTNVCISISGFGEVDEKNPRLTPILISRYLLNLRQLGEPKNDTPSHFDSQFSIPNFRVPTSNSVIEPMGADLDYTPTEELDELDDERGEAHIGVVDTATEVMEENVGSTLSS